MSAQPKTAGRTESIQSLATRLFDTNNRDRDASVKALVAEFRRRPSLHEEIFHLQANDLIAKRIGSDRRTINSGGEAGSIEIPAANDDGPTMAHSSMPSFQTQASVSARAEATRRFANRLTGLYLAEYLFEGRKFILGHATPEELAPIAARDLKAGMSTVRGARYLERVIASAKPGTPIYQSLTLDDLENLKREADASMA